MLSFVCTHIGEQDDLLLPAWATSSFTTVAGQAGWRGVKPSLDALIHVAGAGSVIKAGASQRPMEIVRLGVLIAPTDATGETSPPGYSDGQEPDGQPFWRRGWDPDAYFLARTSNPPTAASGPSGFGRRRNRSDIAPIGDHVCREQRYSTVCWVLCSPEPLAISRMTPVIRRTSRRTSHALLGEPRRHH